MQSWSRSGSILLVASLAGASFAQTRTPLGSGHGPVPRVAYISDEAQDEVFELYGVPLDGSAPPVRLNAALPTGGDVESLVQVAGDRVLYLGDQLTNGVRELFSVPDDGSAPAVQLNGPLVAGGNVNSVVAGKRVAVFLADATVDNREELFSVPLDGSSPPTPLTPGLDVYEIEQLSADGEHVLFATSFGMEFLYVVPTDGSAPPLLLADSGTPAGFDYTFFVELEIAPDGQHVVYIAAEDDDSYILGNIFCARLDGSTPPVKLNPGPRFQAYAGLDASFRISPDGERVLYVEVDQFLTYHKLQSVRLDGTGLVNLVPAGAAASGSFRISDDSVFAVFTTSQSGNSGLELARLDGSQSLELLAPSPSSLSLVALLGGTTVVYTSGANLFGLASPNHPVQLNGSAPPGQGVTNARVIGFEPFVFTPDRRRVVYRSDEVTDEVYELYSAPVDGSQPAELLDPPLSGGRDVWSFRISPDGDRVIYHADQTTNDVFGLFSARIDGSGAAVPLTPAPVTGGDVILYGQPRPTRRPALGP